MAGHTAIKRVIWPADTPMSLCCWSWSARTARPEPQRAQHFVPNHRCFTTGCCNWSRQRLVRRLCPHCRQPYEANDDTARALGLPLGSPRTLFRAEGLTRVGDGGGHEGENIRVHRSPLADIHGFVAARRAEGMAIDVKLLIALGADFLR